MAAASLRTLLDEPRVDDAPVRVWRDWLVVAAILVGSVVEMVVRDDDPWPFASLLVAAIVAVTTLPRRQHPVAMTAIAFAAVNALGFAVYLVEDDQAGYVAMAFLLVLPYCIFRWGSGRDAAIGAGLLVLAWIGGITTDPGTVGEAIGGLTVLALTAALGIVVRSRSALRERGVEEIRLREREQLARELHDTVAHHVSAIAVQAQAGQAVAPTRPEAAVDALAVIEDAAKRTLAEMRTLVGALRDSEQPTLTPRQGVADLTRLADDAGSRLPVDVEVAGDVRELNPLVDAAVYRIAQESITNALRHSRNASRIRVTVTGGPDQVELRVVDDGDSSPLGASDGVGYGVLGMHERAKLLGGTLTSGWCRDGGWAVDAVLPRDGGRR